MSVTTVMFLIMSRDSEWTRRAWPLWVTRWLKDMTTSMTSSLFMLVTYVLLTEKSPLLLRLVGKTIPFSTMAAV